jgi:hypothetical protein
MTVTRLMPNGSPDTAVRHRRQGEGQLPRRRVRNAVALQPNGRIVVAGQRRDGDDFAVARLLG